MLLAGAREAEQPARAPAAVIYVYRAEVERWVDADTVDLQVDLGFGIEFHDRFRLQGIDAWETRGPERPKGLLAKGAVELWAPVGSEVTIETDRDRKGKYGRWLATVWTEDENVNERLVREGHAERAEY
jgi:micrococcal nuclease